MNSREQQIFSLLTEQGEVSIQELSRFLGISPSRVRHNLSEMRGHRFIQRTHGGVAMTNVISYTPLPIHKPPVNIQEARAIAREAFHLIERGDVIGLSGGIICTELALHVRLLEGITVVTNAVNIAAELVALPGIKVMLTGGFLDPNSFELIGQAAQSSLDGAHLNKFFVGTDGITLEHGVTNHSESASLVARHFMAHSDRTILLADSSKFTRSNLTKVAELAEISTIITSECTPPGTIAQFEHSGARFLVARLNTPEGNLS